MAKKTTNRRVTQSKVGSSTRKGKSRPGKGQAGKKIEQLALNVVEQARGQSDPAFEIPVRALSNVNFNPKSRFIEMGQAKQRRNFFKGKASVQG